MSVAATLRPVSSGDATFLVTVYASTREQELALTDWSAGQKARFCQQQFEAQTAHYLKHYPGAEYQVIEQGGIPIGRLYVDRWPKEIRIMDITLLPPHRGRGIGSGLLAKLIEEARAAGKTLSIHVEQFNPAMQLYNRLGFLPVAEHGVHVLMEWSEDRSSQPLS